MNLNAEQQTVVDAEADLLATVAGAGSGKTQALTHRSARLLRDGVHPSEILALTFTRKAAREMRERLAAIGVAPRLVRRLTVTTFHAWACSLLREFAEDLGLHPRFTIRDEADREDLIKFVGAELRLKHKSAERLWREAAVRARYAELLRESNALDFDSLETELLRLLNLSGPWAVLRARWEHVLVDEYQDTSELQQRILDELAPPRLFVVGDGSQSIYGFRGASVEGFHALTTRPGWSVLSLAMNYRSDEWIVEAGNGVAAAMAHPGLKQQAVRRADPGTRGMVRGGMYEVEPGDLGGRVADEIAWAGPERCAVLAPTWRHLEQLAEVLLTRGIPHRLARKALDLWASPEARWLVACLRVVRNPHDHLALWAALNAFAPRVSAVEWARARAAAASDGSPVEVHLHFGPLEEAIRLSRLQPGIGSVLDLLGTVLANTLEGLHLATRIERLFKVIAAIGQWRAGEVLDETRWPRSEYEIGALLDWYATRQLGDVDEPDPEPAVTLITIHGAKGLEWPCVWVLGCDEGTLPRQGDAAAIEEQRRLFYVATTRARDRLRWCSAGVPSRFIAEALRVSP